MLARVYWHNSSINPYRPAIPAIQGGEVRCDVRNASGSFVSVSFLSHDSC